jgi:hypothetical protein
VFPAAVHGPEHGREVPCAEGVESSPAQPRSERRATRAREAIEIVRAGLAADGLSYEDAGAECDRPKQHIGEMLSGQKTMTAADLLSFLVLSPSVWRGMQAYVANNNKHGGVE